jgi:hypothetical protein
MVSIPMFVTAIILAGALVVAGVVSAIAATVAERVPSGKAQPVETGTEERKLAA